MVSKGPSGGGFFVEGRILPCHNGAMMFFGLGNFLPTSETKCPTFQELEVGVKCYKCNQLTRSLWKILASERGVS